jgi:hypothetical protein
VEISVVEGGDREVRAFVKDCHSTHGTRLNGLALEAGKKHVIKSNDILQMGCAVERQLQTFPPPRYLVQTRPLLSKLDDDQKYTESLPGWQDSSHERPAGSHIRPCLPPIDKSSWDLPRMGRFSGTCSGLKLWNNYDGDGEYPQHDYNLSRMPHYVGSSAHGSSEHGLNAPQSLQDPFLKLLIIPQADKHALARAEVPDSVTTAKLDVIENKASVDFAVPSTPDVPPSSIQSLASEESHSDDEDEMNEDLEGNVSEISASEIFEFFSQTSGKSGSYSTSNERQVSSMDQTQQQAQASFTAELGSEDDNETAEVSHSIDGLASKPTASHEAEPEILQESSSASSSAGEDDQESNLDADIEGSLDAFVVGEERLPKEASAVEDESSAEQESPAKENLANQPSTVQVNTDKVVESSVARDESVSLSTENLARQTSTTQTKTGISVEDIIHIDVPVACEQATQNGGAKERCIGELPRPVSTCSQTLEQEEDGNGAKKRSFEDYAADMEAQETPSKVDSAKDVDLVPEPSQAEIQSTAVIETSANRSKRAKSHRVAKSLACLGVAFIAALVIPPEGFYD